MKIKMQIKSILFGIIIGAIGSTSVFAANQIKSAYFNTNKVIYNGKELKLSNNPMISIIKQNETAASNYMPVREVLEQMGYNVSWDPNQKSVIINSNENINNTDTSLDQEKNTNQASEKKNLKIINNVILNGENLNITEKPYIQASSNSIMISTPLMIDILNKNAYAEIFAYTTPNKRLEIIYEKNGSQTGITFYNLKERMSVGTTYFTMENNAFAEDINGTLFVPISSLKNFYNLEFYFDESTNTLTINT